MKHLSLPPALASYRAGLPIEPLWVSPSGRAFYPIAGASPEGDEPSEVAGGADAGKEFKPISSQEEFDRIITGRINQARSQERTKYADYDELKAKAAEHDKAIEAAKTEHERAVEAARGEGKAAALQTANARLVDAEARALAATAKFRNPQLAVKAIDLSKVTVADDGAVDAEAIKTALKSLSDAEPYLLDDGKSRPKPDPAQGRGSGGAKASTQAGRDLYDERYGKKTSD